MGQACHLGHVFINSEYKFDAAVIAMKLKAGYAGYFTRAQFDELQSILGLNYDMALLVANEIATALVGCRIFVEARQNVPSDSEAKESLRDIAKHAKAL